MPAELTVSQTLHLCATTRLAQTLRAAVPAGQTVWRTPPALTLGQWLGSLADEALVSGIADLPACLDPFAEKLLWEKVIAASLTDAAPLFDIQGMAASAVEAHALSRLWNIKPAADQLSDEGRLFAGWQAAFEKRCREGGWIDQAGLHLRLVGLIGEGHFSLPATVVFAGFDRFSPLEEKLMAVLAGRREQGQSGCSTADGSNRCAGNSREACCTGAGQTGAGNEACCSGIVGHGPTSRTCPGGTNGQARRAGGEAGSTCGIVTPAGSTGGARPASCPGASGDGQLIHFAGRTDREPDAASLRHHPPCPDTARCGAGRADGVAHPAGADARAMAGQSRR